MDRCRKSGTGLGPERVSRALSSGSGRGVENEAGGEEAHLGGCSKEARCPRQDAKMLRAEVVAEVRIGLPAAHDDEQGARLLKADGADEASRLASDLLGERAKGLQQLLPLVGGGSHKAGDGVHR